MWVTTRVTYDGHSQKRGLSLKATAKGGFRALLYVCLLLGVLVAVYQVIWGGIVPETPGLEYMR